MRLEPYVDDKMNYDEWYLEHVYKDTAQLIFDFVIRRLIGDVQYLDGCEDETIEDYFDKTFEHILEEDFYYFEGWSAKDALVTWFQQRKQELENE